MTDPAKGDWARGQIVVVPHAWRDDGIWGDTQAEFQDRVGTTLRAMYADLLQQPLSPQLAKLVREIEAPREAPEYAG
jgi:hypothetical protein